MPAHGKAAIAVASVDDVSRLFDSSLLAATRFLPLCGPSVSSITYKSEKL